MRRRIHNIAIASLCFIVLLGGQVVHASSIQDSLKQALNIAKSDSSKANLYWHLADLTKYNNPDSSILYTQLGLSIIENSSYAKLKANLWRNKGIAQYVKGSFDEALFSFLQSKEINEEIEDYVELANSYNNVGLIYAAQKDHEKGIGYYQMAMQLNIAAGDTLRLGNNYYNTGISFRDMGLLDSAEYYFQKGLQLSTAIGNYTGVARCHMFLGEIMATRKAYAESEEYFELALSLIADDNKWDRCFALAGYANVLQLQGDTEESENYALESLALAKELNAHWELQRVYRILANIYESNQAYQQAYEAHKLYKQYADSVYNKEQLSEINRLHLAQERVKTAELQNENLKQQQDIARQQFLFLFAIVVLVLLVLLAIFIYRNYLQKMKYVVTLEKVKEDVERKNTALTELNTTKDKLFSIISHDLKGPISSLQSMFRMIVNKEISKGEFLEHADTMSLTLESLNLTLVNLLHWAKTQMLGASTQPIYFSVSEMVDRTVSLLKSVQARSGVQIETDISEKLLAYADKEQLYLVVRNLISNAIKFTPELGKITISASRMPEGQIMIKVQDTGIGMTDLQQHRLFRYENQFRRTGLNGEKGTGLGLILCDEMMRLNKGQIKVVSEPDVGSTFTIICSGKMAEVDHPVST
ncbi:MAG: tetratricopeptide repeat-containing sensor histidine kinase [Cyclobacteriaceae bacterium]